ncbi:MAG: hypothetical protein L0221_00655, partial [Chloroflexi bacterium]|nr:hypothetical protein [Chloroflexota bacterium]
DAPSGLADRVMGEVVLNQRSARRFEISRWLAVAATLVVVVVLAVGGGLGTPTVDPSSSESSRPTAPTFTRPPTQTAGPITAADLPVLSVEEAIAIRDLPDRSDELAVEGWIDPVLARTPVSCTLIPVRSPLLGCHAFFLSSVSTPYVGGGSVPGPALAFRPIGINLGWIDAAHSTSRDAEPIAVVAVGHFDDRRSPLCRDIEGPSPSDDRDRQAQFERGCRDHFVVDQFASVSGAEPGHHLERGSPRVVWSYAQAEQALQPYAQPAAILSSELVSAGALWFDEPALRGSPFSLASAPTELCICPDLWLFRVLVDNGVPRVDTYIVVDGAAAVYRSNGPSFERLDGWVEPTGEPYVSVDLDEGTGITLARIWDRSGTLIWARTATADDPEITETLDRLHFSSDSERPNHVRLTWLGGACESYRIVVESDARIVRIQALANTTGAETCPAGLIRRDFYLLFGQPTMLLGVQLEKLRVIASDQAP